MITAHTRLVGLMGWPVSHSRSPAMHNAAFAAAGLDWAYATFPVKPGGVGAAVAGIRALGMAGANVTVPHKQAVIEHLDQLTEAAQRIGAVNTISVTDDGALLGDNTDAPGFVADLREHAVEPREHRALVLGAGGAARAVVVGLAMAGCAEITVLNRTPERARAMVEALATPGVVLRAGGMDALAERAGQSTLVINSTSVGMHPHEDAMPCSPEVVLQPSQVVYDLVYAPRDTRLLRYARTHGARAIGGLGMLLHQGALAFERWTGVTPDVQVMRDALTSS